MCAIHQYLMHILLVRVYFNTFLKRQQNFTSGMLCTKTISGMQNQLNVTNMYNKLDICV